MPVEHKMCKVTTSFNSLVDSHASHQNYLMFLKAKGADLEDKSRRNLKIRGIPETVQAAQLPHFVREQFKAVVPNLTPEDLTINRIPHIPKPSFLSPEVPRDVLMQIHFFQVKEKILEAFRRNDQLPVQANNIQVLPDFSQYTLKLRRKLNSITKVIYKWKYPAKLSVTYQGKSHIITSLDEGMGNHT